MRNQQSPTTEPVALEAAPRNAQDAEAEAIAPLAVEVDTSETPQPPLRAKRDGCDCLPSTVQCVHFGDVRLVLNERILGHKCDDCRDATRSWPRYYVSTGSSVGECETGGCLTFWNSYEIPRFDCPDLPSAQLEFDRRAEELAASDA